MLCPVQVPLGGLPAPWLAAEALHAGRRSTGVLTRAHVEQRTAPGNRYPRRYHCWAAVDFALLKTLTAVARRHRTSAHEQGIAKLIPLVEAATEAAGQHQMALAEFLAASPRVELADCFQLPSTSLETLGVRHYERCPYVSTEERRGASRQYHAEYRHLLHPALELPAELNGHQMKMFDCLMTSCARFEVQ